MAKNKGITNFREILRLLTENHVEFILVGGVAATAHGSVRLTLDIDIVYRRTPENQRKLVEILNPYVPYLRGAPTGLPFRWDEKTMAMGLNFTLTTSLGDIDLLGEITGGGRYENLLPDSAEVTVFKVKCYCLKLEKLIHVKRAAGRPKDFEAIAELEALAEERKEQD